MFTLCHQARPWSVVVEELGDNVIRNMYVKRKNRRAQDAQDARIAGKPAVYHKGGAMYEGDLTLLTVKDVKKSQAEMRQYVASQGRNFGSVSHKLRYTDDLPPSFGFTKAETALMSYSAKAKTVTQEWCKPGKIDGVVYTEKDEGGRIDKGYTAKYREYCDKVDDLSLIHI